MKMEITHRALLIELLITTGLFYKFVPSLTCSGRSCGLGCVIINLLVKMLRMYSVTVQKKEK